MVTHKVLLVLAGIALGMGICMQTEAKMRTRIVAALVLTPKRIAATTPTQLLAIKQEHITEFMPVLEAKHIAALTPECCAVVKPEHIAALTPPQKAAITPEQRAALTPEQMTALISD